MAFTVYGWGVGLPGLRLRVKDFGVHSVGLGFRTVGLRVLDQPEDFGM